MLGRRSFQRRLGLAMLVATIALGTSSAMCSKPSAPTAPDASAKSCRLQFAGQLSADDCAALLDRTDQAFSAALARAPKSCASAGDCINVQSRCTNGFCAGAPIASSGAAAYASAIAPLRAECDRFNAGQCMACLAMPTASCSPPALRCVDGSCAF
jgi:hypothetical protein